MRTIGALAIVLVFLGCSRRHVHSSAGPPTKYGSEFVKEVPALSLRGDGCHVEVLDSDNSVICAAIAFAVPRCALLNVTRLGVDGDVLPAERFNLGSNCPSPRFSSGVVGPGTFFVERGSQVFGAICDNASPCQRSDFREQILDCCGRDKTIQNTAVCEVAPHEGLCLEPDK